MSVPTDPMTALLETIRVAVKDMMEQDVNDLVKEVSRQDREIAKLEKQLASVTAERDSLAQKFEERTIET